MHGDKARRRSGARQWKHYPAEADRKGNPLSCDVVQSLSGCPTRQKPGGRSSPLLYWTLVCRWLLVLKDFRGTFDEE